MNKSLTNKIKYNRICNYTYIKVEKRKGKKKGGSLQKKTTKNSCCSIRVGVYEN